MLIAEAEWIRDRLAELPDDELFPLLNVGSSTRAYRTEEQPHVHREVFAPLEARGGQVWHTDLKPDDGVDLVGDFMDPAFVERLNELAPRSLMVSNVLQHVTDPLPFAARLAEVVPTGGLIIASGPRQYPYTADPIDTMLRPDVREMAALFPGTELVTGAEIDAGAWSRWNVVERGRTRTRFLARLAVPFYRPRAWALLARQAPYLIKPAKATAVVLRRI